MKRIWYYLIMCLSIVSGLNTFCQAQERYFRHLLTDDGLTHNTVLSILQNKKGFMWLGTKDGLNRFDGFTFKKFRNARHPFGSIGDNQINAMAEDIAGKIWLATGRGIFSFDPRTETFNELAMHPSRRISAIATDGRSIWFLASDTLWSYQIQKRKLLNLQLQATCLSLDAKHQLWLGTGKGGVLKLNPDNGHVRRFQIIDSKLAAPLQNITTIECMGGELMIGTSKMGFLTYSLLTQRVKTLFHYNKDGTEITVRSGMKGAPGEYWIGTETGILIYHTTNGRVSQLQKDPGNPYAISDNAIYAFLRDSAGGIWVGTYFGGLNYYAAKHSRFRKYYRTDDANSIAGNAISAIIEDQQKRIWIGTEDAGISSLDPGTGTIQNFRPGSQPGSLGYSNVHSLLPFGNELLVGLFHHGLEVLDIHTSRVIEKHEQIGTKKHPGSNFVLCLLQSKQGKIYLGTIGPDAGLYDFNPRNRKITAIRPWVYHNGVFALTEDHQGRIWVGTANQGAICYDPHTGRITRLKFGDPASGRKGAAEPTVHCIYEDSQHNLWFGTEGGGIVELQANGLKQIRYTTRSGLSSNYIYQIREDHQHQLWMSSVKGLMRMHPATGKITTYTQDNGLLTDQFNYGSSWQSADGRLYFGTVRGLIAFDPKDFISNIKPPPLHLTNLEINDEPVFADQENSVLQQSISYTENLDLSPDQNNMNIEFAALDYSSAGAIRYRYRMRGLHDTWTYLNKNRKVYFTGLSPGKYIFEFAAESNTGEWKTKAKKIFIRINPPVYRNNLAYAIYFITLLLGLYYALIRYQKHLKYQHERKMELYEHDKSQELYQSKIDFFTHVAHELRTPLTLIKLPLDQLSRQTGFTPKVNENLTMITKNTNRLIELTNQLLDFRKSDRENLRLAFVKTNVNTLLEDIYNDFQLIATQKEIQYQLDLPRHLTLHAFLDIEAFKKIMNNLLSNAFKYAEKAITIRMAPIHSEDDCFNLEVKNDGVLISEKFLEKVFEPFFRINEKDKFAGSGIGLSLARSLTLMHNGTLMLRTDGRFNIFMLSLPLHQDIEIDVSENVVTESPATLANEEAVVRGLPVVLLVEDHNDILKYIAQELQGKYQILKAGDGAEAIEILQKQPVHLVVSDIMMPRMNGIALCNAMKTDLTYSHIPVILLTAKNSVGSRIEGLGSGADAYIEKPFSMLHLEAQIESLLRNRKLVKAHFARSPISQIQGVAYTRADVDFLELLTKTITRSLNELNLDVDMLSGIMNMSRPTLYRKIKALTDMTPSALIALYRLKHAAELLAARRYQINEIAFMVGYNSPANFTRDFQKQFGITPSAFLKA